LRGNAQNKVINLNYIDSLLGQCEYISTVTFSGGEPSLHPEIISSFLEMAKNKNVGIGGFYIATNGIDINVDFVINCLKMYAYCYEKDMCSVVVSNDLYHANENSYNTELLDGLSFFSRKHEKERDNYGGGSALIKEGRAAENFDCRTVFPAQKIKSQDDFNDVNIYLNCNGQIINGCDWSYLNQSKHILCKVDQLEMFYNSLPE
jgi:hypothetical protein